MAYVLPDEAVDPLVLTLDFGTSSIRAMVYDGRARLLHPERILGKASVTLNTGRDGEASFHPGQLLEAACTVIDHVLETLGSLGQRIRAVSCDSFASSMVVLDPRSQPISEVFTYADNRCSGFASKLREKYSQTGDHDRTGCMTHSSYWPARLAWLQSVRPELFTKGRLFCSWTDWVFHEFFGQTTTSLSLASWTGMLNRRTLTWDKEWLGRLGIDGNRLSPLADFADAQCGLLPKWGRRWPVLADIPWYLPVSDGAAANVGGGAHKPGRIALTIGTTAAMRAVPNQVPEELPLGLWNYRIDRKRPLVGGATTEGGNIFAWMRQNLPEISHLEERLSSREVGCHGLTILPFWAGERAPNWNDNARGVIAGISLDTTPVDMVQASLESVACRLEIILRRVVSLLGPVQEEILAGGGFLSSPFWMSRVADAFSRPLLPCLESETTSRGVAILALEALGVFQDTDGIPDPEFAPVVHPDKHRSALFARMISEQQELYQRIYGTGQEPFRPALGRG